MPALTVEPTFLLIVAGASARWPIPSTLFEVERGRLQMAGGQGHHCTWAIAASEATRADHVRMLRDRARSVRSPAVRRIPGGVIELGLLAGKSVANLLGVT